MDRGLLAYLMGQPAASLPVYSPAGISDEIFDMATCIRDNPAISTYKLMQTIPTSANQNVRNDELVTNARHMLHKESHAL